ncbi:hypothetical protein ZWY2020_050892 [Hordeum vulgare]|nr:hypothetical protein ZWY2020_050892 [Hordeum vulgare]
MDIAGDRSWERRMRRILNLGLFDGAKRAYSLWRLDLQELSDVKFFHPMAQEAAAHGKACELDRKRRTRNTRDLATETPMINPPESELLLRPPQVSYSIRSPRVVHFLPTFTESKVVLADWGNRMLRTDIIDGCCYVDTLPGLHGFKHSPLSISVPPAKLHRLDGQDTGDLYIIDSLLHPNKAEVRPQFEALVWRGITTSIVSHRFWQCDILPLPPWITHHRNAFVYGHALVGDTICFSISSYGSECEEGTYCFHTATREWSKAGDWLMPFYGKADYVPELGLWFGISSEDDLPCAADISGVIKGEEPPPDKIRIWVHDDMPAEWRPSLLSKPRITSLGSGRFMVVDFLDAMVFDKDCNEMCVDKRFALFTGMEVAYSNGKVKNNSRNGAIKDNGNESGNENGDRVKNSRDGAIKDNGNESGNGEVKNSKNGAIKDNDHTSGGNENGSKGKGVVRGLRMIKHKSARYMLNNQQCLQEVL